MPKPTKGPRLGGSPAHERIILRNLASQLFEHGRVVTTAPKPSAFARWPRSSSTALRPTLLPIVVS